MENWNRSIYIRAPYLLGLLEKRGVTIHMQARYAVQPNQKRLRTLPVVKAQAIVVLVVHREYALTPKLVSGPRNTRCLLHPGPELVLVTSSVLQGRDMPSVAVQPGGRLRRIFAGLVWSMGKVSCHPKRKTLAVLAKSIGLECCMQNDGVMVDIFDRPFFFFFFSSFIHGPVVSEQYCSSSYITVLGDSSSRSNCG